MHFIVVTVTALVLSFQALAMAASQPPEISAEAACLLVAHNQRMLYGKEQDKIMYPASTTKIMTLLVALQRASNVEAVVTVNGQAAACEGSSLDLEEKDRLTLQDLLFGLMLVSGNDAAEVIAEHIGGSVDGFVRLMNAEAWRLGANNTNFANPHGLPNAANHFTTAKDLAVITAAALKRSDFLPYVTTLSRQITFHNTGDTRTLSNTNELLTWYTGANGVKTGYTNDAGLCLVASAKRNGIQLIAVVFNDDNRWQDAAKLLDYGFAKINEEQGAK